ncbi:pentatricopeptide repeat-containing protein At1g11290, chloroplastic-like [Actinidia eriantha]|uniref:pentatricopeptide repeat-containing protein At1g11290, chloroplastic-like n=1 Tax=Actinidia eriantha TaxID=165200 RepID=UPI0025864206|nr:pentatricopeptide repeat-containing protein At1g11290, chloroplastic-like [Actinidia eriantha]
MQGEKLRPNSGTLVGLLSACGEIRELRLGRERDGYCLRNGVFDGNAHVGTALIGFYSRFGVEVARVVFEMLCLRNVVSWNAIISRNFDADDSWGDLEIFVRMIVNGVKCDSIKMLVVIQASAEVESLKLDSDNGLSNGKCLHAHAIKSGMEKNASLGNANAILNFDAELNRVQDAFKVFGDIRDSDVISWNTLILALAHNGFRAQAWELFEQSIHCYVIKHYTEINPSLNTALIEMYMNCNNESTAKNLFDRCPDKDLLGCIPDLHWVLHEEWDEKMKQLFSHSEKLAIAFGLISASVGTPILITKNLRVCGDCHEFGKYVSKLVGREIVLRDDSRFYHFVSGLCSCKDY